MDEQIRESEKEAVAGDETVQNAVPEKTAEQKFLATYKNVNDSYLYTLILSGAIMLGAIVIAVTYLTFLGLAAGIVGALVYMGLTSNLLYSKLGISYRGSNGKMTVTQLYGKNRETVYVPPRLIMLEVTEIDDCAFDHKSSSAITTVYLPATLTRIGKDIFKGCPALCRVHFAGSEEQWEAIEKQTCFDGIELVFSSGIAYPEKAARPGKAKKEEKQ